MGFIDPRTDFGFKRIFGSPRSKPILRNFLNAIVYNNEPRITDLEILDPYQNPDLYDLKQSILDIKVILDNGTTVIIEMQVLPVKSFTERIIYNTAKAYVSQLKRGQGYRYLKPIISLTIVDFVLFPDSLEAEDSEDSDPSPISRYQLINPKTGKCCSDHVELIFAELPKLAKLPEELKGRSELWLYFIKQAGRFEQVPEILTDADFEPAFEIANESQLSPAEYELAQKQQMRIWDEWGRQEYARDEGIAIGVERGREEGLIQAARGMIAAGVDGATVCQATGLAEAVVQKLVEELR